MKTETGLTATRDFIRHPCGGRDDRTETPGRGLEPEDRREVRSRAEVERAKAADYRAMIAHPYQSFSPFYPTPVDLAMAHILARFHEYRAERYSD
jgi:hypothetical protein